MLSENNCYRKRDTHKHKLFGLYSVVIKHILNGLISVTSSFVETNIRILIVVCEPRGREGGGGERFHCPCLSKLIRSCRQNIIQQCAHALNFPLSHEEGSIYQRVRYTNAIKRSFLKRRAIRRTSIQLRTLKKSCFTQLQISNYFTTLCFVCPRDTVSKEIQEYPFKELEPPPQPRNFTISSVTYFISTLPSCC